MERSMSMWKKVGLGVAAAGLAFVTLIPTGHGRRPATPELSVHQLVYGSPDSSWTKRAAELAVANPGFAERLARVAESEEVGPMGRAAAFEALANAGTDVAQGAMREALDTATIRTDPDYSALLARLSNVHQPTPETTRYLAELHDEAVRAGRPEVASAAALDRDGSRAPFDARHGHQARTGVMHKR
jgi:hypothetical protein